MQTKENPHPNVAQRGSPFSSPSGMVRLVSGVVIGGFPVLPEGISHVRVRKERLLLDPRLHLTADACTHGGSTGHASPSVNLGVTRVLPDPSLGPRPLSCRPLLLAPPSPLFS